MIIDHLPYYIAAQSKSMRAQESLLLFELLVNMFHRRHQSNLSEMHLHLIGYLHHWFRFHLQLTLIVCDSETEMVHHMDGLWSLQ